MTLRTWLAGFATLLLAATGFAEIRTYMLDADNSSLLPTERRIYRGDGDAHAATPNAGDITPDQCACTPNVDCAVGQVPDAECSASPGRPNGGSTRIYTPLPKWCQDGPRCGRGCTDSSECDGSPCTEEDPNPPQPPANNPFLFTGVSKCQFEPIGGPGAPPPPPPPWWDAIVIDDTGNGTPTLVSMTLTSHFDDFIDGSVATGIPGTTVMISSATTIGVSPNQTGTGDIQTWINWGTLTGWSQTGNLFCRTTCPGGCNGASACTPLLGFEGLGPPTPLASTAFDTGPWTFSGGGTSFTSASFEVINLAGGAVTASLQLGGRLVTVPALPLGALGGLAAGLLYLGARTLGRKRE